MKVTIPKDELVRAPRAIGTRAGRTIYAISTVGGLHVVADADGDVLGAGPHGAIARHVARKQHKDIEFDDLAKAEDVPVQYFQDLVPAAEELTAKIRARGR